MKWRFGIVVVSISIALTCNAQAMKIDMHTGWEFCNANSTDWIPATVPGCVHTDLLNNKRIPDPFYGSNESEVQWIEQTDWIYRKTFSLTKQFAELPFIELQFDGLDTYADVFVNDTLILEADNMFHYYRLDVKPYVHAGENEIRVYFHSPSGTAKALRDSYHLVLPTDERVFVRKAQYQFGWDWGPRLVTSGIWRDVSLTGHEGLMVKLDEFTFRNNKHTDTADIQIRLEYNALKRMRYEVQVIETTTNTLVYHTHFQNVLPTYTLIDVPFAIPERWMPYGYGNQVMYHFKVVVKHNKHIFFEKTYSTGFSNIQLHQEPDASGKSFYFSANGQKIFVKGANLIPLHSFPSTLTEQDYRKLLLEAKEMHINMIRVWGGGIYEHDHLYALCDSLGIMVWQDFMFACAIYPGNVIDAPELQYQAQRISTHPCIALWCGNNEIDEAWNNWGWQNQYKWPDSIAFRIENMNKETFTHIVPEVLGIYGSGNLNYHPSSPTHGWGRKESLIEGDAHYWGVWWGKQPFSVYNQKVPRFMSEYGFQGMPSATSMHKYIPDDEWYLGSASIRQHQKHPTGYETINEYMQRDYPVPVDLDDYIYVSQLLQADGMHTAIEAHRRNMPYCMGTMFWQLNDCWPVTSWSVIDHYGERKAAFYTVKNTYQDVIISTWQQEKDLQTWIVNDRPEALEGTLTYTVMQMDGRIIDSGTSTISVPARTSTLFSTVELNWLLKGHDPSEVLLYVTLYDRDSLIAARTHLFTAPKALKLKNEEMYVRFDAESGTITLQASVFMKGVYIRSTQGELRLSDNFFDLLPNTVKQISLQEIPEGGLKQVSELRITTLNTLLNQ